ncbi:MAG: citrate/2-methylcitrate synthase, partial [Actinomycetota bacterium]
MTTYLRSGEAARRLGVTTNTLYAYVSRGRVNRTVAADGRTSLFDLDEIDALREASRRGPVEAPPSIDVRIATGVTRLDEDGPTVRGRPLDQLIDHPFESVAELLWTGEPPSSPPVWSPVDTRPRSGDVDDGPMSAITRLALDLDDGTSGASVGRRLLATIPDRLGTTVAPGASFAHRLAGIWVREPDDRLVRAVDAALVALADHELATSTLAVRIATSTRASTTASLVAGLATVSGDLHGGAARHVHLLLADAGRRGARSAIDAAVARHGRVPGFGHAIYRRRDPRFELLMPIVRDVPSTA